MIELPKGLIERLSREPEKKFGIERLKALAAQEFTEKIELEQAEKWIRTLEKSFRVVQCAEESKVEFTVLLQCKKEQKIGEEE